MSILTKFLGLQGRREKRRIRLLVKIARASAEAAVFAEYCKGAHTSYERDQAVSACSEFAGLMAVYNATYPDKPIEVIDGRIRRTKVEVSSGCSDEEG